MKQIRLKSRVMKVGTYDLCPCGHYDHAMRHICNITGEVCITTYKNVPKFCPLEDADED